MIIRIKRRKILIASVMLLVLFSFLYWMLFLPPASKPEAKLIFVKKGMTLRNISELLEEEGIIRSNYGFLLLTLVLGKRKDIKAGEYEIPPGLSVPAVLDILVKGQFKRHLVTIPEGYTVDQIAQLLDSLSIVRKEAFIEKATSPVFIDSLGIEGSGRPTLEGYLFPDTYHLYRGMEPEEILRIMVNRFRKIFDGEMAAKANELGISRREALILASIIEKETALSSEKFLISAVLHNRLKKGMPLQSDPTVIYGTPGFDGNLTKKHLRMRTPYNTYLNPGLPPTPICNPGKESLMAALSPAPVPYLYFVSKNDGSHHFSTSIEEHNRAVARYQKR